MTTPESRTVEPASVEERLAAVIHELFQGVDNEDDPRRFLAAAKEHGLVIGEGERLDELRAWVAKQRATPSAEHGSFASTMTGEQGYDAALEELEARLR